MRHQDRDHERNQRKSRYAEPRNPRQDHQGREAREGVEDRWRASEEFSERHFTQDQDRGFGQADRYDRSYAESYREPWVERSGLGRQESQQRDFYGKGPKNYKRSDERIKEEVYEALTWNNDLDATDIEVGVKDGEVTLSGTVSDRRMKRLAEEVIEDISGVKDVNNQLKIKKSSSAGGSH